MQPDSMTASARRALGALVLVLAAVDATAGQGDAGGTSTTTIECGYPGVDRHSKVVDAARCFVGDLCCCRYDAFDFAELLLTESDTVLSGRIEHVAGLPASLLVRRELQATIMVEEVFRSGESEPPTKVEVRLSSDMFVWPETGESRIVARQAMASEHEAKVGSLWRRLRSLDPDADATARSRLNAERERLGTLRWDWEGEIGVIERTGEEPFPNCGNGVFTVERGGALEAGGTYLFALDDATGEEVLEYRLPDNERWNVFWGDEMDEVVHALAYTKGCLSWPEIVYGPENEYLAIDICVPWARGRTLPNEVGRRR